MRFYRRHYCSCLGLERQGYIDEKEFFREFTLRICSSLDIEKALSRCFRYVRNIIPADELCMAVYDPGLGTVDVVVRADDKGGVAQTVKTPIPPHLRKILETAGSEPAIQILEDVYKAPLTRMVAKTFKAPHASAMISWLVIEGETIGALSVVSIRKRKYSPEHARLWALVKWFWLQLALNRKR